MLRPESGERTVEEKQEPDSGKEGSKKGEADSGESLGGHGRQVTKTPIELFFSFQ